MYGKLFGQMFEGSLYGKGWGPLLVMSYVIANAKPDREVGTQVELNPKSLADKFGEDEDDVRRAIEFLCQPDPESTSPDEDGRRLVKLGAFAYKVVNGAKYRAIRDEETRRAQVRKAMAKHRAKKREEALAKNPAVHMEPGQAAAAIRNFMSVEQSSQSSPVSDVNPPSMPNLQKAVIQD